MVGDLQRSSDKKQATARPDWEQSRSDVITTMEWSTTFASLFIVASTVLSIAYQALFRNRSHEDFDLHKDLNPTYLQEEWEWLRDHRTLQLVAAFFNAIAWLVLCIPILKLAWFLYCTKRDRVTIPVAIAAFALAGSICELLATLLLVGAVEVLEWVSRDFNLDSWVDVNDMIGWRTLEVVHLAVQGMLLWINAIEWLFLFGILTLTHLSVRSHDEKRLFSMRWSRLGIFMSLLCILSFVAGVLRLVSWRTFAGISVTVGLLNRLVLIPIWLVWLGRQLPAAEEKIAALSEEKAVKIERPAQGSGENQPSTGVESSLT